jgi:uncharacterized protein with beta-barrel porin domain
MSSNKVINLVKKTALSNRFTKVLNKFSIFAIIFGAIFGTTNSAKAVTVIGDDIWGDGITTDATGSITDPSAGLAVDLQDESLTVGVVGSSVALGAVTAGTGNDATSDLIVTQDTTAALTFSIASIAANVADFKVTAKSDATAAVNVTVSGTTAVDDLAVNGVNTTNDFDATLNLNGALTVASSGTVVLTAAAKADAVLKLKGAGTNALIAATLNDDTGLAILEVGGTAAQALTGTIDGVGAAEGTIKVTNTVTAGSSIAGVIGGNVGIKEVITNASTKLTTAGATLTSATVTNAGTLIANGATSFKVDTVANTGTLTVKSAALVGDNGSGVQTITNTGTLNLIGEATVTATATIVGAGTINVYDGSGGGAIVNTISGLVGADGTNVTAINVGADDGGNTDAGQVVFTSNVFADAVAITSGQDGSEISKATFKDNLTGAVTLTTATGGDATAIFLAGDGNTTVVAGAINGAGDVLVESDGTGITTFNSNLGTGTTLKEFHISDADIADVNLNLSALTITFDDAASKLDISGAVAQTVTGLMDGDTTGGVGILQISSDATIVSNIGATQELGDIIIGDAKSATFSGIVKTEDFLMGSTGTGGSSVTLAQDGHIIGDRTQGDTGILTFGKNLTLTLDDTIVAGETIFDVDFTDSATATNGVVVTAGTTIKLPGNFTSGAITLIDGDVALAVTAAEFLLLDATDTALSNYTLTHTDSLKDVTITATDKSTSQAATALKTTNNKAAGFLQARSAIIAAGTAAELDTFTNILNDVGFTAADETKLANEIAPQTEMISGSTVAAQGVSGSVQGIISNRMASLRSGDAFASGMSAGGAMSAKSGFIQVFGSSAEQKSTTVGSGTKAGFDSESSGVAIGFDGISDAGTTVGLALSMSNTDLDSKGTGKAKNDMDTYTASIYMDKATDTGYVEGSLTFGLSESTTSRKITAAGLDRTLSGAFDSQQISLNVGVGMPNDVGVGFVTPFASFTATTIETDAYNEKSTVANDALRLKLAQDDVQSAVGSIGVKYHNVMDNGGVPMISFAVNNEFGDNSISSKNTYLGGGTAFKTTTDVEELSATLGVGYSMGNDYTSIEFAYEADANDDEYLSHGGSIKIVGKF